MGFTTFRSNLELLQVIRESEFGFWRKRDVFESEKRLLSVAVAISKMLRLE